MKSSSEFIYEKTSFSARSSNVRSVKIIVVYHLVAVCQLYNIVYVFKFYGIIYNPFKARYEEGLHEVLFGNVTRYNPRVIPNMWRKLSALDYSSLGDFATDRCKIFNRTVLKYSRQWKLRDLDKYDDLKDWFCLTVKLCPLIPEVPLIYFMKVLVD